ncbi:MAG: MBL fold metallo-hydrolase [Bdellovibrionales bacterium]|nr:MBL fold metallo-hydrolase [Bdellovibrionales bacterium]
MDIKLWGVRGSLPIAHAPEENAARLTELANGLLASVKGGSTADDYLSSLPSWKIAGYGGETTCYEVKNRNSRVIVDGGTGLRKLGDKMLNGPLAKGQGEAHIVFTHFHWDHVMGLPYFKPLYIPGNKIHFYSVQPELEEMMRLVFKKPYFPVAFEQLGSEMHFHQIDARKPLKVGTLSVTPYLVDHPDPCYGFRIQDGNRAVSICTDTETVRKSREEMGEDLALYQETDLLIYDAQYTLNELADKINWGHSAGPLGIDIALREKIKKVLFVHHDPGADDNRINEAERETRAYYEKKIKVLKSNGQEVHHVDWSFAYEGQEIHL